MREAIGDVMRFWLDRGVDGFRVDVLWHLIKDAHFRDNPPNPEWTPDKSPYRKLLPVYSSDQPEVHDVVAFMRGVLDRYDERLLIGEIYLPVHELIRYYGEHGSGVQLPFNFQLIVLPWEAEQIGAAVAQYEASLPAGAWPNWVLGNHDKSRVATRAGAAQARNAAMLLLTLRGTPTMYYGDEIGMQDVAVPPGAVHDPVERRVPGIGMGRDPERTPMQWDHSTGAGFTTGTPWLPLATDAATRNVAAQRDDPRSMLALYRALIALRRRERALSVGEYEPMLTPPHVLGYRRSCEGRRLGVLLNFASAEIAVPLGPEDAGARVLLSTGLDREQGPAGEPVRLRPDEGVVLALPPHA